MEWSEKIEVTARCTDGRRLNRKITSGVVKQFNSFSIFHPLGHQREVKVFQLFVDPVFACGSCVCGVMHVGVAVVLESRKTNSSHFCVRHFLQIEQLR
jgi:hypothetical protein